MADLEKLRQLAQSAIQPAFDALLNNVGGYAAFRQSMAQTIQRAHTAAYVAGTAERLKTTPKAIRGLSRAERKELQHAVSGQLKYLDGFVADLRAGRLTMAQANARALLYAGAAQATYGQARYPGLNAYPGDGSTPCLGNCRCHLEERDGGVWWVLSAAEHCAGCVDRAAGSPYKVSV